MTTVREQAARWFARIGNTTPDDPIRSRFEEWLLASPEHAREYEAFAQLWDDFDSASGLEAMLAAQQSQRAQQLQARRRRKLLGQAGGGLLLACLGLGLGMRLWPAWRASSTTLAWQSGVGEIRRLVLPDGSRVTLDAQSSLGIVFAQASRQVVLTRGAAVFEVQHDASRPFTVDAGLGTVTVLGTRFAIQRLGDDAPPGQAELRVAVAQGLVRVDVPAPQPTSWRLSPGDALEVSVDEVRQRRRDLAADFNWMEGTLVFDEASLAEVAARLSRYRNIPVRLVEGLPAVRVTAVVQVANTDVFLRNLPSIVPVRVEQRQDEVLILPR